MMKNRDMQWEFEVRHWNQSSFLPVLENDLWLKAHLFLSVLENDMWLKSHPTFSFFNFIFFNRLFFLIRETTKEKNII